MSQPPQDTTIRRRTLLAAALAAPAACALRRVRPEALVDSFASARAAGVPDRTAPYLAVYERRGRQLAFVAARHENGVASATHARVRKAFDRYPPRAVVVEGFPTALGPSPPAILRTAEEGSSWGLGESGYAARLADATAKPFWGGEPTDREIDQALLAEGWSAADLQADNVLRMLPQTVRAGQISSADDPRLDPLFAAWVEQARDGLDGGPTLDRAEFDAWYARTFGVPFATDPLFAKRHRADSGDRYSRLVERQATLRDEHLFRVIRERLAADGEVLVVYGASHLFTLWRALDAELGAPEIA